MLSRISKYLKLGSPSRKEIIFLNAILIVSFTASFLLGSQFLFFLLPIILVINIFAIAHRGYLRSSDLDTFITYLNDTDNIKQFDSLLMVPEFRTQIEKFRKLQKVQKQVHSQFEDVRNELLDNLSHELRTPMFAVLGFLETLQSGKVKDEKTRERFTKKAYTQATNLNELLNDMIELSSLQSRKDDIVKDKNKIYPIVHSLVEKLTPKAEEKGNKLILRTDNYEVENLVNEEKIKLAISHLLTNAIKYTDNGEITIQIKQDQKSTQISVTDTGIGIPSDEVERIFERLYKTKRDRDVSNNNNGSGMGLAIVKHILIAHNAKIDVNSVEGEGTKFTITLFE